MFKVVYNREEPPAFFSKSIYLAGTNIRNIFTGYHWRDEVLEVLERLRFDGVVFYPAENPEKDRQFPDYNKDPELYLKQINWEKTWMDASDAIIFWTPRSPDNYGLASSFELGKYINSGRIFAGSPDRHNSTEFSYEKNNYFRVEFYSEDRTWYNDLSECVTDAVKFIGFGSTREGVRRHIPSMLYNHDAFSAWLSNISIAGHELEGIRPKFTFVEPLSKKLFYWLVDASVKVTEENRSKNNEFVTGRSNLATLVIYSRDNEENFFKNRAIFVREFRSPANNEAGYVLEFPSGSIEGKVAVDAAVKEFLEETGIEIKDFGDLTKLGSKQVAGTLSAHTNSAFSLEISKEEMDKIQAKFGEATLGDIAATELTYIEIRTFEDFMNSCMSDWGNIGLISAVVAKNSQNSEFLTEP